ncbi:MAG TPA: alkaline phosphatase family protein, partial [Vicinamibacteria bacterium]
TGAWPDGHGVTGNEVVLPGAPLNATTSGYRSEPLLGEPLWVTAAREGLEATVLCATQDYPYAPYEKGRRFGGDFGRELTFLTGYQGPSLPDAVFRASDLPRRSPSGWTGPVPAGAQELELKTADDVVFGLLFADPEDPAPGLDTLALSINKDVAKAVRLKARSAGAAEAFEPVRVRIGGQDLEVFFRLFALSPDGQDLLLYRARAALLLSNHPTQPAAAAAAMGGFVGNGASDPYEEGALGPTLAHGGDGTAEKRYLETVRLVERQFERLLDFGAQRTRWEMLVGYLPFPDELLHLWWGHLDPELPGHDPVLARRLRPYLDEGLRVADAYVGALRRHADARTVVAVGADHGMTSVRTRVRMNAALREAGLLSLDAAGRPDLARTKAYYLGAAGYFLINRSSRPGGIVKADEEDVVRAAIADMLRGLRDPRSRAPLVAEVLDPRERTGAGGPHGGDVYFRLAPHVFPTGETQGELVYDGPPSGEHLLAPESEEMQASFVVSGAGVAQGALLGRIRQVDAAPTLSALLGLGPPAASVGEVLAAALARSPKGPRAATR